MSRTIRVYNKWASKVTHPYHEYGHPFKQWIYGKASCLRCKDDMVFIHVHNKRKRILLKTKQYNLI